MQEDSASKETQRLVDNLQRVLDEKRERDRVARMQTMQALLGLTGNVRMVRCPHCNGVLVDPRPQGLEEDYDTRV